MTTAPSVPPAPVRTPGVPVDLVDVTWQRIQVQLRLSPSSQAAILAPALRLRDDSSAAMVAPAGVDSDADAVVVRFNVMQGPDQRPLRAGRWSLVGAGGEPVRFGSRDRSRGLPGATFPLAAGELRYVPTLDQEGAFALLASVSADSPGVAGRADRVAVTTRAIRRRARSGLFRLLLRVARTVGGRNGRRILFTSNSRPSIGGNLEYVRDRMVERGLGASYELGELFKPGIAARRSIRDRLRMPWLLARADVVFVDDYHPVVYGLRDPAVRIVQLWHAFGAFKTFDYSRVGKPGAPSPFSLDHKNYSLVTVGSPEDVPFYAEAFGVPEARVAATGIPRMDAFVARAAEPGIRDAALARFPEAGGRTTILFAPTFRGFGGRTASYPLDALDYAALHALCMEKNAVFIVRLHPHVRERLPIPDRFRDRLLEDRPLSTDTPDLLYGADLLVTDYSSILFEYAALGRPMLFYAFDLDDYRETRDFYVEYESFVPGRIARTFPELLDAIRRDDYERDKVPPFAARYLALVDGRSADRIIDLALRP
ncbi:MAG TPA: CDP-glycerol glycerophosphotransferase family protein [Candidatus Limnocylindrales bacterium]|nr:CDP-glycerol glycerophosphotransferase family protein [Candidatus Limnocylindrales bacterium]